jgi:hypothetical protein
MKGERETPSPRPLALYYRRKDSHFRDGAAVARQQAIKSRCRGVRLPPHAHGGVERHDAGLHFGQGKKIQVSKTAKID